MGAFDSKVTVGARPGSADENGRRPYTAPRLRVWGTVGALTQAGSGQSAEMMPGMGGPLMEDVFP